jgi:hypothetical protein
MRKLFQLLRVQSTVFKKCLIKDAANAEKRLLMKFVINAIQKDKQLSITISKLLLKINQGCWKLLFLTSNLWN